MRKTINIVIVGIGLLSSLATLFEFYLARGEKVFNTSNIQYILMSLIAGVFMVIFLLALKFIIINTAKAAHEESIKNINTNLKTIIENYDTILKLSGSNSKVILYRNKLDNVNATTEYMQQIENKELCEYHNRLLEVFLLDYPSFSRVEAINIINNYLGYGIENGVAMKFIPHNPF